MRRQETETFLTLEELREMDACALPLKEFEKTFGQEAKISRVVEVLHKRRKDIERGQLYENWETWLLSQDDPALVGALLRNGADPNVHDGYALSWAAESNFTGTILVLLENGADVHIGDDRALRRAAEFGSAESVKILLENGADIHVFKDEPLYWAVRLGYAKTVKVLLESGADVHIRRSFVLNWVGCHGSAEMKEIFRDWLAREEL